MVNLARSLALACAITTLLSGLSSLFQPSCILLYLNREAHRSHRQRLCEMLTFSQPVRSGKVIKKKAKLRFWVRPGRTRVWWDNFVEGIVSPEEWKENFRIRKDNFYNLCDELRPFIMLTRTKW